MASHDEQKQTSPDAGNGGNTTPATMSLAFAVGMGVLVAVGIGYAMDNWGFGIAFGVVMVLIFGANTAYGAKLRDRQDASD